MNLLDKIHTTSSYDKSFYNFIVSTFNRTNFMLQNEVYSIDKAGTDESIKWLKISLFYIPWYEFWKMSPKVHF